MKKEELEKYNALRRELESLILKKVDAIKEKTLTHSFETLGENIQVLTIVSDELDDILLNWEPSPFAQRSFLDLDEDDD